MSGDLIQVDRERAHASLHALSQPLTVLSLALTIVQGSSNEMERAQAMEAVVAECHRATRSVYQLRALLEEGTKPSTDSEMQEACLGRRVDWMFGGMA